MKLIARNEGPKYNGSTVGCLTPGKEYKAIDIFFPTSILYGKVDKTKVWSDNQLKNNPSEYEFYIRVFDDNNRYHDIPNDYFLSTEEIREINLNILT